MSARIHPRPQAEKVVEPSPLAPQRLPTNVFLDKVAGLVSANKLDEVQAFIADALQLNPTNGDVLNAQGYVLSSTQRQSEALSWYCDALEFSPMGSGIWNNLGTVFKHLRCFNAAIACHQRAVSLSHDEAFLHHNLGLCYAEIGQHGEAVQAFNRAIELQPDFHLARWDRARSFLHLGNYRQGWADYEVRLMSGQIPTGHPPGRAWTGTPYGGSRLVILVEQGFGDTLWALRYLPKAKALGGKLIVECQPALCALVSSLGIADQVIAKGEPLPDADYHCFFCSLPGLFTADTGSMPRQAYLRAPSDRLAKFRPQIEKAAGRLKVGIVWSGSVTFERNADRAISLQRLLQAVNIPHVQLYSLQKGPPQTELRGVELRRPIIDLAPMLEDFADTAAVVSNLDLVIMTDSSVAHLAGALGVPVWLALGHSAHWLWLLERSDSPWYPSTRLFRPRIAGDWEYVLENIFIELMKLATARMPLPAVE
ncbi:MULTISPECIES: tetratricopeptide repeat protein [unclassified Bradyrhizobium]|uniref:tetratricopeptide repeat protein n=1 Tax=unclassified Bradyrhizobium TaxID=2631580 RepID=UPI0028E192B4|nr:MULTISPECIES: tetratricopeptide repeat protein [unclassified Bradyrhizobium]